MDRAEIEAALDRLRTAEAPELRVLGGTSPARLRRIGLVPGSFDPMTVAHAALAGALRTQGCDVVILVLSARTLPKDRAHGAAVAPPLLEPAERVASLLAYGRRRSWLRVGLASPGLLVDQAEAAARSFPGAELLIGLGSDKLLQVFDPRWNEDRDAALDRLLRAATLVHAMRTGDDATVATVLPPVQYAGGRIVRMDVPPALASISPSLGARVRRSGARASRGPPLRGER